LAVEPTFPTKYPNGIFVVCDARFSGEHASITVLRYLFHASLGKPLVAEQVQAKLHGSGSTWRVVSWSAKTVDYAP